VLPSVFYHFITAATLVFHELSESYQRASGRYVMELALSFHKCVKHICEIIFLKKQLCKTGLRYSCIKYFMKEFFMHRPAILIVTVIMPYKKNISPPDVDTVV
jgi:hypothetical protein